MMVDRTYQIRYNPWIITVASCFCYGVANSFAMSLNVFTEPIVDWFHVSYKENSIIATLAYCMICGCAPASRYFIEKFGLRLTMFLTGIVASICQMACAFTRNFIVMVLLFGVTCGICLCTASTGSLLLSGCILDSRYQHVALAAASTGTAIGLVIQPIAIEALLENYGFPHCLLVYGAFTLNICVAASFFPVHLPKMPSPVCTNEKQDQMLLDIPDKDLKREAVTPASPSRKRYNFHFDILTTWRFWAINFAAAVFGILQTIMGTFNMSILEQQYSIDPKTASIIVSIGGGVNIAGRLSTSFFQRSTLLPRWWTWSWVNVIVGLSLVLFGSLARFYEAIICQIMYAFFMGLSMTLYYVVVADIFPTEQYNAAISFGLVVWAIGVLWTPLAGWLRDVTKSFTVPLMLFGGLLMGLSSIAIVGLAVLRFYKRIKLAKKCNL